MFGSVIRRPTSDRTSSASSSVSGRGHSIGLLILSPDRWWKSHLPTMYCSGSNCARLSRGTGRAGTPPTTGSIPPDRRRAHSCRPASAAAAAMPSPPTAGGGRHPSPGTARARAGGRRSCGAITPRDEISASRTDVPGGRARSSDGDGSSSDGGGCSSSPPVAFIITVVASSLSSLAPGGGGLGEGGDGGGREGGGGR